MMICATVTSMFLPNILGTFYPKNVQDTKYLSAVNIYDKRFFVIDDEDKVIWNMVKMIPNSASVIATADILPALAERKYIREILKDDSYKNTDYIFINTENKSFGTSALYVSFDAPNYSHKQYLETEVKKLENSTSWGLIATNKTTLFLFKRK